MAKSGKEITILLITLLITTGAIGVALYGLLQHTGFRNLISAPSPDSPLASGDITNRLSAGERILITAETTPEKEAGTQAIASSDFPTAVQQLEASLRQNRNDPEALIYLNNARIGNAKALAIAVSVPIGANLNVAQEILRGVAQAQQEINQAGGINQLPLRVIIANDDNQPNLVQPIAQQFVNDPTILAVVGHNSSDASLTGAAIYQAAGLVMISPTATAKELSGFGNFIYRTALSAPFQANALALYAKTNRRTNIGICYSSSSDASKSLKDEFTVAVYGQGGTISRVECDLSSSSFNPAQAVSALTSDGVDALLLNPGIDEIERALTVARESKGKFLLLGDSTLYTFKTLEAGQADVNGMILTVPWHPQAIPNQPFPSNAVTLWGGSVNWRSATAYDAVQAIAAGLRQNPTRSGLQQALASPTFSVEGATGEIQFQSSGDRLTTPLFVTIQPSSTTSTGYDFVAIPTALQP